MRVSFNYHDYRHAANITASATKYLLTNPIGIEKITSLAISIFGLASFSQKIPISLKHYRYALLTDYSVKIANIFITKNIFKVVNIFNLYSLHKDSHGLSLIKKTSKITTILSSAYNIKNLAKQFYNQKTKTFTIAKSDSNITQTVLVSLIFLNDMGRFFYPAYTPIMMTSSIILNITDIANYLIENKAQWMPQRPLLVES